MRALDHEAARSLRHAVHAVRPPNRWIESGQELACALLAIVILLELAFIARVVWQIWGGR